MSKPMTREEMIDMLAKASAEGVACDSYEDLVDVLTDIYKDGVRGWNQYSTSDLEHYVEQLKEHTIEAEDSDPQLVALYALKRDAQDENQDQLVQEYIQKRLKELGRV